MSWSEKYLPGLKTFAVFCAGAALGRVIIPSGIDDMRRREIAAAVTAQTVAAQSAALQTPAAVAGDVQEWKLLKDMDRAWPGHIDWVIRRSDEARTLFQANGQQRCPAGELLKGQSRCIFVAPPQPYTIRQDPSLPPAVTLNRGGK